MSINFNTSMTASPSRCESTCPGSYSFWKYLYASKTHLFLRQKVKQTMSRINLALKRKKKAKKKNKEAEATAKDAATKVDREKDKRGN